MKKFLALLLVAVLLLGVAACAADPAPAPTPQPETPAPPDPTPPPAPPVTEEVDIRIALVAHSPESILDDGSFNAGAHAGILQFMETHGIPEGNFQFFQATEATSDARIDQIESAIEGFGANVLILPGFHFSGALYRAQDYFPDSIFVLLDASPAPDGGGDVRIEPNLVAIHYAEEESGFLAGYAAVMEGYTNLGFTGGVAVPAVVRFGHGFIQGAEFAAASLGLDPGEITIRFHYFGGFAPDPAHVAFAGSWFADGVEVIFAAAGGAGFSVITAAEAAGATMIGVDVDQSGDSDVVITSAIKGLAPSVYAMLTDYLNGTFVGGREAMFNAAVDGVGLPMETSRFTTFTQAQYDAIFAQLAAGSIVVNSSLDFDAVVGDLTLVTVLPT